ncbi:hypothetical protein ACPOL_1604 [Acidisarcina polymorpha]|uniref:Mobile element protein n=1 Tax=Acidisarcina polymorpha TaxID=2211140 RepID=A0A2Z5FW33_9BACT|nr:hypothetical protein ACPOL_1604 [Acidisarcina polymorpha]
MPYRACVFRIHGWSMPIAEFYLWIQLAIILQTKCSHIADQVLAH